MSMSPEEWKFYTYALGYLTGRSGGDPGAVHLTTEPERWLAGYRHGKGDGVTHQLRDETDYAGLAFRTIGAAGCDLYDAINGARTTEEVMRLVKAAKAKLDALPEYEMGILSGEREAIARWMVQHGYATGHGDTVDDLLQHLVREATERSPAVGTVEIDEALVREIAMQVRHYEPICVEKVRELLDDIRQGIRLYLEERGQTAVLSQGAAGPNSEKGPCSCPEDRCLYPCKDREFCRRGWMREAGVKGGA